MLKIRLTRRGKKNKAFFRIVVAEHTSPIKGGFLEVLGFLNPHTKEKNFKADRIQYWIGKGAQCSDSVHNLLVSEGISKGPKKAMKMKKKEKPAETPADSKPSETAESKTESKANEKSSDAKAKEEPKEAKEAESVKTEPEKKEAEAKESEKE